MTHAQHTAWEADEAVLAATGQVFFSQDINVTVHIPRALAEAAMRAWDRDDDKPYGDETPEQARARARAGVLALIGLAIREHGRWRDGGVELELPAWYVGLALDSADEAGLLEPPVPRDPG